MGSDMEKRENRVYVMRSNLSVLIMKFIGFNRSFLFGAIIVVINFLIDLL